MTIPVATGLRNKLLTFYRRSVSSRTTARDIGGYTWTNLGTRWAQIKSELAGEQITAGQVGQMMQVVAICPYMAGLTSADKVTMGGVDYGIDAISDVDGLGIEMQVRLKDWVEPGD